MKRNITTLFNKEFSGSFTLEAAVILPLVLFALIQCVLLAFTMHDIVCAKNVSYRHLIDYSMNSPNHLTLYDTCNSEQILNETNSFTPCYTENDFSVTSEIFSSTVTFSNYNNTEQLRKYLSAKRQN